MSLFAVIGGSGLYQPLADGEVDQSHIVETPYGTCSAPLIDLHWAGQRTIFLSRHGEKHHIAPHQVNYRANLWALKQHRVTHIIAVNAVGGIHPDLAPEAIAIPDQIIDYTYGREMTFVSEKTPVEHVDFTFPYSDSVRQQLIHAAERSQIQVYPTGVYGATQGPRLETAAEIQRLTRDGCDMVGMTAMPEAVLARELNIEYASISLVVNWAAGLSEGVIKMSEIERVLNTGMQKIKLLISETFK